MNAGPAGEPAGGKSRRGRWLSIMGFVVGGALLAGALLAVGSRWGTLSAQWHAAGGGAPWGARRWGLMAGAALLPAANWACTSATFWVVTRRYGRVGFREMGALIAVASLLNYLPIRAGMVGRVAYHRAVNGIPIWASVKVLGAVLACTGVATGALLAVAALAGPGADRVATGAAVTAPGVVLAGVWAMAWARDWPWACYAGGVFFRYLDMLAWTGRYAVAFALWGQSVGLLAAAAVASTVQIVALVPLAGNVPGLREWSVGYTAKWLGAAAREVGLAADLVNRAGELVAAVPLGLWGWAWVSGRLARLQRDGAGGGAGQPDNL